VVIVTNGFGRSFHDVFLRQASRILQIEQHVVYLGDWTEHFGIYPHRKPTNASKLPLYCDA
jgi:hypothetical protein